MVADRKRDADLERELRSDLEFEEEEQRENGLSPEEAHYAARRAFGNTTLIREQIHDAWGWAAFERLSQDISLCLAAVATVTWLHCRCCNDAYSRYWRYDRDLHPGLRCDASPVTLYLSGPTCDR